MFRTLKTCTAALGLAALGLGGCATVQPEMQLASTYLSERMSAEEAGYTQVFVDTILAACETARSTDGRRYLRRQKTRDAATGLSGASRVASLERRLVRSGPKTVRPVFRSVREFHVPLVETPPITARHTLAAQVQAPMLYETLHADIVELMVRVDEIKQNGNRARVSDIERVVVQAQKVCEGNSLVVAQTLARAEDSVQDMPRLAVGPEGLLPAAVHHAASDEGEATVQMADQSEGAAVEMVSAESESLIVPAPARFLTVQQLSGDVTAEGDMEPRLRFFLIKEGMTLDLDPAVEAIVQSNETLDTLVTLR